MKQKTQARNHIMLRYSQLIEKRKVISATLDEDKVVVCFEGNVTLKMNKAEAEILKVQINAG